MQKDNVYSGTFPNEMASKVEKDEEKFGLQVGNAILNSTKEYIEKRNRVFSLNRTFAEGKQSVQPYLDQMQVDGNNVFSNIRFKPRPIASKFHNIVVDGYAMREEYAKVVSMSKHVQDRKDKKKSDARYRMQYKDEIAQLSQEVGIPIEDPREFTPESEQELDIYFALNDREREELLMQEVITFTLEDNDLKTKKKKFLGDQFVNALSGYYNYLDNNGRLRIDVIAAEDCVYSNTTTDDFSDLNYAGRFLRMSVAEARNRFKISPEKEKKLFSSASSFSGKFGNPSGPLVWEDQFRFSGTRPYDGHTIQIFHFWWKCNKVIEYVETKDSFRTDASYIEGQRGVDTEETKTIGKTTPLTAYEGFMLLGGGAMLEWGEQRNILRKGEDKEEVLCPFIFHMPNNSGRMDSQSSINKMIDMIEVMDLAILQIKKIIASAAPDGYIIDVNGLMELDLGEGLGVVGPLTLNNIYRQTGNLYYSSKNEDGDNIAPPVQPHLTPFTSKIEGLINQYNFELSNIREALGVNEFRDGSANNPRTGFRFAQAQLDSSNTATWHIYNAYLVATQELVRQIGIRIWDSLAYGEPNKGYMKLLGKINTDLIKERTDITASTYDFKYEIGMQETERQELETNIQICLENGTLQMPDAIMIREVNDIRLAMQMLNYYFEKRRKERMEEAQQNQQSAADYSAQAGERVEQARQQTVQMEVQLKASLEKEKEEGERDLALEKAVWEMIQKEQEGIPIPPKYVGLVDLVLQNRGIGINVQADEKVAIMQQQAEQQEFIGQNFQ